VPVLLASRAAASWPFFFPPQGRAAALMRVSNRALAACCHPEDPASRARAATRLARRRLNLFFFPLPWQGCGGAL